MLIQYHTSQLNLAVLTHWNCDKSAMQLVLSFNQWGLTLGNDNFSIALAFVFVITLSSVNS